MLFKLLKKALAIAGILALPIIPTPSFSGEVEQQEMMSVTEQLLPLIGEKYKNLNKKEKKTYKKNLLKYLKKVEKTEATGISEGYEPIPSPGGPPPSGEVPRPIPSGEVPRPPSYTPPPSFTPPPPSLIIGPPPPPGGPPPGRRPIPSGEVPPPPVLPGLSPWWF